MQHIVPSTLKKLIINDIFIKQRKYHYRGTNEMSAHYEGGEERDEPINQALNQGLKTRNERSQKDEILNDEKLGAERGWACGASDAASRVI